MGKNYGWKLLEVRDNGDKTLPKDCREVVIAYCQRKPLSLEEFKEAIYDNKVKVSVDSFGGDEEAYQKFLESDATKGYVQVD
jgi:hypothetical protein